jgi:hypothetical protein
LAQLLAQEPREPSRTLARSTIDCALRRRIEHHRLKELKACRHGLHLNVEALRGHMVKVYQDNMAVVGALRKMPSKSPALMVKVKGLVPWLNENKIHLDVVCIRSDANLADAPSREWGLDMWSLQQPTKQELLHLVESTLGSQVCTDPFACKQSAVAPRFATPLKICHSVMVSRSATAFSSPLPLSATAALRLTEPSRHGRDLRQSSGATAGSGLRLCVKDRLF